MRLFMALSSSITVKPGCVAAPVAGLGAVVVVSGGASALAMICGDEAFCAVKS
jgi:hypothetical protein